MCLLTLPIFAFTSLPLYAQEDLDSLFALPLEDLLNIRITTSTKTLQRESEAPSIITVITSAQIKSMGARGIKDILKTVPGFDVIRNPLYGNQQTVAVRGLFNAESSNAKIKVMVNGKSIRDGENVIGYGFDSIPIQGIRQIEIIRGPGSALYGTDAYLGIINIVTKDGSKIDNNSMIITGATSYGSFDTSLNYIDFKYKNDRFSTFLFAEYNTTNGHTKTVESDSSLQEFQGIAEQIDYPFQVSSAPGDSNNNHEYTNLYANVQFGDLSFQGMYSHLVYASYISPLRNVIYDYNDGHMDMGFVELEYKKQITDKAKITLKTGVGFSENNDKINAYSRETVSFLNSIDTSVYGYEFNHPEGESVKVIFGQKDMQSGAEIVMDYKPKTWLSTVTGVFYEHIKSSDIEYKSNTQIFTAADPAIIDGNAYFPNQYLGGIKDVSDSYPYMLEKSRDIFAVYEQVTMDIKGLLNIQTMNSFSFTTGVRLDDYSDFGRIVNPRAGIVCAPKQNLFFKALYGTAFRAPTLNEMYTQNNPAHLSNPNLDPEKISTTELLVGYYPTPKVLSKLTGFYIQAKDLIQEDTTQEIPIIDNIGKQNSTGVEGEIQIILDKNKTAFFNITYQDVKNSSNETIISANGQPYTQKDYTPGGVPSFIANIGGNYDFAEYVNANFSIHFIAKRKRSKENIFDEQSRLVRFDQREPIGSSMILNASFIFDIGYLIPSVRGVKIQASGYNLLNKDTVDPDFSGSVKNDLPVAGKNYLLTVSYEI